MYKHKISSCTKKDETNQTKIICIQKQVVLSSVVLHNSNFAPKDSAHFTAFDMSCLGSWQQNQLNNVSKPFSRSRHSWPPLPPEGPSGGSGIEGRIFHFQVLFRLSKRSRLEFTSWHSPSYFRIPGVVASCPSNKSQRIPLTSLTRGAFKPLSFHDQWTNYRGFYTQNPEVLLQNTPRSKQRHWLSLQFCSFCHPRLNWR